MVKTWTMISDYFWKNKTVRKKLCALLKQKKKPQIDKVSNTIKIFPIYFKYYYV